MPNSSRTRPADLPDVRDFARQRSDEAKAALPGEQFYDREIPWQATVRGHIVAALDARPEDDERGEVAGLLERAVGVIEDA